MYVSLYPTTIFDLYFNASARRTNWIASLPAKSAIVRETFPRFIQLAKFPRFSHTHIGVADEADTTYETDTLSPARRLDAGADVRAGFSERSLLNF